LKIEIFDLSFERDFYYIQRNSIVEKITIDNRTLYSKFEKIEESPTPLLVQQHLEGFFVMALPCANHGIIDYLVIEYEKEENNHFFYLIKHLLKSLGITTFYTYESSKPKHVQIFIPRENLRLQEAYDQVEKIEQILEVKSSKRCKILPNKNLPINHNKITLPLKKM